MNGAATFDTRKVIAAAPSRAPYVVALAGFVAMLGPGALYAYSLLAASLARATSDPSAASTLPFALANLCLGLGAAFGGRWLRYVSPRVGAFAGCALWGAGNAIAGLGTPDTRAIALGYGALGGFGCGLVYVSVLAAIVAWFPRRAGLAGGFVVCGFGLGAPLFSRLVHGSLGGSGLALAHALRGVFLSAGLTFAILGGVAAAFLREPPVDPTRPDGYESARPPVRRRTIALIWSMLFVNALAGLVLIGNAVPLIGDLVHASPRRAAELFAVLSLANAAGRLVAGALSDRVGGAVAFRILFGLQIVAFLTLSSSAEPVVALVAFATILFCYGGGFGVMPGVCLSYVGVARFPATYGTILTAWGLAGLLGPFLSTMFRDFTASFTEDVTPIALLLVVALLLPSVLETSARPDEREPTL